jgi:hypothetical protein
LAQQTLKTCVFIGFFTNNSQVSESERAISDESAKDFVLNPGLDFDRVMPVANTL